MRKSGLLRTLLALLALALPGTVQAGVFQDDLTRCLVKSATPEDQIALAAWIFSAMSAHPDITTIAAVPQAKRDQATAAMATLSVRLLATDCRRESVAALKYEGEKALAPAFEKLGEMAMTKLMTDAAVNQEMEHFGLSAAGKPEFVSMIKEALPSSKAGVK